MTCPHCAKRIRTVTSRVSLGDRHPVHEHLAQPCGHGISCDLHAVFVTAKARRAGQLQKGERLGFMGMCRSTALA